MAELIIPVGFGAAAIRMLDAAEGKIVSVTWGYQLLPTGTAAEAASAIHDAITGTGSLFAPLEYGAGTYLDSIYVLEHIAGGYRSFDMPVSQLGTRSGAALAPPQVSLGLQKRCEFVGKRQRGRLFLPAMFLLTTDYLERGSPTASRITQVTAAASVMLIALSAADVPMYLLHSHPDDAPSEVLSLQTAGVLRTQRRRLPRS